MKQHNEQLRVDILVNVPPIEYLTKYTKGTLSRGESLRDMSIRINAQHRRDNPKLYELIDAPYHPRVSSSKGIPNVNMGRV